MRGFVTGLSLLSSLVFPRLSPSQALPNAATSDQGPPPPSLSGASKLFDGKSLRGWTTQGGRYDGKALWSVERGCIVGQVGPKGEGGLLYTQRAYANFVFACDVQIDYPFDSGIFIGMESRSLGRKGWQVTLDHRPGGEIGGIYSDGWLQHNSKGWKLFQKNKWNRVIIRSRGFPPRIETWVRGRKIGDYQQKSSQGFSPLGKIGLQVHGAKKTWWQNKVRFKNIQVLELPPDSLNLFQRDQAGRLSPTPKAISLGWRPMLTNLDDWTREGKGPKPYKLNRGLLTLSAEGAGNKLWTKHRYKNFELRLDFKLSPSANSGLLLFGNPGPKGAFSYAYELQILDDWNWEKSHKTKLKPWQHCGSLYGLAPPLLSALLPPGSWNSLQLSIKGNRLKANLNGRILQDLDLKALPQTILKKRPKEGSIGLQFHGGGEIKKGPYLWIRNFFLRKIE